MIVEFSELPDDSRLWIYQSNRNFSDEEIRLIQSLTESFLADWQAHNKELEVSYEIRYNRFLILAVNESFNSPGGCSIDLSIRFIQDLSNKINIDLLDRMSVNYRDENDIKCIKLDQLKSLLNNDLINGGTIIFNNLVKTKIDYINNWESNLENSWLSQFIK
tara:strand:+ start:1056 stop:1541 length:486 start_codon:yes stop_codon:yes gene_type:complete